MPKVELSDEVPFATRHGVMGATPGMREQEPSIAAPILRALPRPRSAESIPYSGTMHESPSLSESPSPDVTEADMARAAQHREAFEWAEQEVVQRVEQGDDNAPPISSLRSTTSLSNSQNSKKPKTVFPVKLAAAALKRPRRESIASLQGNAAKPRSIYAPSPTPLQCSYLYPIALGPPRRPVDLRCAKRARIIPEAQVPPATAPIENGDALAPMDVDAAHKITHRCPITFSREFEMRRHIRTVHIAEEVRAVVEGLLPREEATVIPENWDGKTFLSKV
ncbi:hypothetical protein FRC12_017437 [Ceratobasidium sp. 428]|nr:hypothetical protein FRC12_017437 [Ceratobasidium sp. 428]